jgi:hypothetical protein
LAQLYIQQFQSPSRISAPIPSSPDPLARMPSGKPWRPQRWNSRSRSGSPTLLESSSPDDEYLQSYLEDKLGKPKPKPEVVVIEDESQVQEGSSTAQSSARASASSSVQASPPPSASSPLASTSSAQGPARSWTKGVWHKNDLRHQRPQGQGHSKGRAASSSTTVTTACQSTPPPRKVWEPKPGDWLSAANLKFDDPFLGADGLFRLNEY